MNNSAKTGLFFLGLLAIFIWIRDVSWTSGYDDTLPILVCLPLFAWLAAPWVWKVPPTPLSAPWMITATAFFVLGSALSSTFLLALGWSCFLWTWICAFVGPSMLPHLKKLMVLPLMAFPWIALDAERIGWYFRLTGAAVTEAFFSLTPIQVGREGTLVTLNEHVISVESACSGLNTLQSMLIAGTVVCYTLLGKKKAIGSTYVFFQHLPFLQIQLESSSFVS